MTKMSQKGKRGQKMFGMEKMDKRQRSTRLFKYI